MKDTQKKHKHHGGKRLNASATQHESAPKVTKPTQIAPTKTLSAKDTLAKVGVTLQNCLTGLKSRLGIAGQKVRATAAEWDAELPHESAFHALVRIPRRVHQIWSEGRQKHFPESNRFLVQVFLLCWGAIPGCLGLLTRSLQRLYRRTGLLLHPETNPVRDRESWHVPAFLSVSGVLAAIAIFCSVYTIGTVVRMGDTNVAVKSPQAVELAMEEVEAATSQALGQTYTLDKSQIAYEGTQLVPRDMLVEPEELLEDVSGQLEAPSEGYALYVDGAFIGATPYEGALEEVLTQLKSNLVNEDTISCDFAEDVEVRKVPLADNEVINLGHLAELLYSTKEGEVTYTVVKGDTWSHIASSHDLTSKELLAMNPGYDINRLSIGETLTISVAVPYLTVTVQQREHYVDEVPYQIEYTDSADMYRGDYKVTSAGSNGTADTVANVTYINGVEVQRTILSSVNLQDPVTEQRLQGTKERPSWMATGSFRWPTSGHITSYFGYRNIFSGASKYHQGIDIANGYGTPIYAADGGTVVFAGWQSGYGYLVKIDHGNGYETRYGHNSSLLVSVGDKVYKGEQISRMGSTGVSSGNHCHFEIRYHGTAKNPLNYI